MGAAKHQIGGAVGKALATTSHLSFLQQTAQTAEEPSVMVKALAAAPPDPTIKAKIDSVEDQRAVLESGMLNTAIAELGGLTKIVVAELEKALQVELQSSR